jgi:hypothetical protein
MFSLFVIELRKTKRLDILCSPSLWLYHKEREHRMPRRFVLRELYHKEREHRISRRFVLRKLYHKEREHRISRRFVLQKLYLFCFICLHPVSCVLNVASVSLIVHFFFIDCPISFL